MAPGQQTDHLFKGNGQRESVARKQTPDGLNLETNGELETLSGV